MDSSILRKNILLFICDIYVCFLLKLFIFVLYNYYYSFAHFLLLVSILNMESSALATASQEEGISIQVALQTLQAPPSPTSSKNPRARPPPLVLSPSRTKTGEVASESPTKMPAIQEWVKKLNADTALRRLFKEAGKTITFAKKMARQSDSQYPPVEFLPGVWLGNQFDTYEDYEHVVSVMDDPSLVCPLSKDESPQNTRKHFYARDDGTTDIMALFPEFMKYLDSLPSGGRTLIHCQAGINRSATLATAYYMRKTGKRLLEAIDYMVRLRPIILCNEDFLAQLTIWSVENVIVKSV